MAEKFVHPPYISLPWWPCINLTRAYPINVMPSHNPDLQYFSIRMPPNCLGLGEAWGKHGEGKGRLFSPLPTWWEPVPREYYWLVSPGCELWGVQARRAERASWCAKWNIGGGTCSVADRGRHTAGLGGGLAKTHGPFKDGHTHSPAYTGKLIFFAALSLSLSLSLCFCVHSSLHCVWIIDHIAKK